jgi:hypothetical protein
MLLMRINNTHYKMHAIDITPAPILVWLEGLHKGVVGGVEMLRRVLAGRGIAAADVAAA